MKKKLRKKYNLVVSENKIVNSEEKLFKDVSELIYDSKNRIVDLANSELITLFWKVGKKINDHVLKNKRAEYGKQIVVTGSVNNFV
jgi:hypothetical protein